MYQKQLEKFIGVLKAVLQESPPPPPEKVNIQKSKKANSKREKTLIPSKGKKKLINHYVFVPVMELVIEKY